MAKDIPTLMTEFRAIVDHYLQELLTFEDSDVDKYALREYKWGRTYRSLRGVVREGLDEFQVHSAQIQGARVNVFYRKLWGTELSAKPPEHLKNMAPRNPEKETGMYGRTHLSRLARDVYFVGHQFLSQVIGVDESLMEEPARPGEWSGREVLEHMVDVMEVYKNLFTYFTSTGSYEPKYGISKGRAIPHLVREIRASIDTLVQDLLGFEDSDLDREVLIEYEWGREYTTLRGSMEDWLDEVQIHSGQLQGARVSVAYRRIFGADLDASPPDHLKNITPVREEEPWGMNGRSEISRLAAEMYVAGHQLLAQFIGIDESLMGEPSKPGEWSGKQVLEHLIDLFNSERAEAFAPYRKEGRVSSD